jgi:hypothetical protein
MKFISNMEKLKVLTESLIDRDYLRVKIINLFDTFCNDFPIPMNAWIVDSNLKIISNKGSLVSCKKNEKSLNNIFENKQKEKNIEMHKRALSGDIVTYIISDNGKIYLTKLVPSKSEKNLVFGISMDITSFTHMISVLDKHCDLNSKNNNCEILDKVKNDSLYMIIKSEGY